MLDAFRASGYGLDTCSLTTLKKVALLIAAHEDAPSLLGGQPLKDCSGSTSTEVHYSVDQDEVCKLLGVPINGLLELANGHWQRLRLPLPTGGWATMFYTFEPNLWSRSSARSYGATTLDGSIELCAVENLQQGRFYQGRLSYKVGNNSVSVMQALGITLKAAIKSVSVSTTTKKTTTKKVSTKKVSTTKKSSTTTS